MCSNLPEKENEESSFGEFRQKVRSAQVLSPAMERLLCALHFTGRVSVVVQNGRVLKSGYEEGYFRQHEPAAYLSQAIHNAITIAKFAGRSS